MLLIVGTLSYNFTVVFPLFAEHGLHGGDGAYTMIYSCFSAGCPDRALVVARRTDVSIRTVALGCAWLGAGLLVLSLTPDVAIACVVAVGVGGASIAFTTAVTSIAQIRTDQHMIGACSPSSRCSSPARRRSAGRCSAPSPTSPVRAGRSSWEASPHCSPPSSASWPGGARVRCCPPPCRLSSTTHAVQ